MNTRPHVGPHAGPLNDRATPAGTAHFRKRFASLHPGFFRTALEPWTRAQRALQVARSTPGVTTTPVCTKTPAHVHENPAIASCLPLSAEPFAAWFA